VLQRKILRDQTELISYEAINTKYYESVSFMYVTQTNARMKAFISAFVSVAYMSEIRTNALYGTRKIMNVCL
jgi:hypothetical protein